MQTCSGKEWDTCRVEKMGCTGCHYNNPPADEIFEKLGYKKKTENDFMIEYVKVFKLKGARHIIFTMDKEVCVCEENKNGLAVNRDYFSMQELQAIYKKSVELWGVLK